MVVILSHWDSRAEGVPALSTKPAMVSSIGKDVFSKNRRKEGSVWPWACGTEPGLSKKISASLWTWPEKGTVTSECLRWVTVFKENL